MVRDGVFGDHNFNEELTQPMKDRLKMDSWGQEFNEIEEYLTAWAEYSSASLISASISLLGTSGPPPLASNPY